MLALAYVLVVLTLTPRPLRRPRGLGERTQFVVITHNRGTMSQADALYGLYGVTMAEGGVSQVAGIRLEDVEVVRRSRAG